MILTALGRTCAPETVVIMSCRIPAQR